MQLARVLRMLVELFSLLIVLTVGLLTPGPDFIFVFGYATGRSRRRALAAAAGVTAGVAGHMLAISVGLTAMGPGVVRGVQLGGAAFLAWLGGRTLWRAARAEATADAGAAFAATGRAAFVQGLICNLTNARAFLFYVSVFVSVLRVDTGVVWRILLPVLFVVHAGVAWTLVVITLQAPPVARRLAAVQRFLPWVFGALLCAFAVGIVAQAWPFTEPAP